MIMTTYFKDTCHGPTEFPQWAIDLGFIDVSWHNDAAAKADLPLPRIWPETKSFDDHAYAIGMWVSREKLQDREDDNMPRFIVSFYRYNPKEEHTEDSLFSLYTSEDEAGCELMVKRFLDVWHDRS